MSIPSCGVHFIANLLVSLAYGLPLAIRFRNIKLRNKAILTCDMKKNTIFSRVGSGERNTDIITSC
jgi:hypothetical protein